MVHYLTKGSSSENGISSFHGFAMALAILYALAAVVAFGLTGPTVQSYNIADSVRNAFHIPPLVTGIVIAILFAIIVVGGAKRIGSFASYVVPFMAGVYIVLMFIILGANITRVPAMFGLIFRCAFNKEAALGAIFGSTIMWGVKRGAYSSEAGQGSGAQASSAAEVSHPVKQGLAQAFSVYIDTLVVCTATGLMILCTGCYNIVDGAGNALVEALPGIEAGTGYTQAAIDTVFPGFGSAFIADVGVGLIAWFNLLGLLFLVKPVAALLKDFEKQKKLGLDPVFVPEDCGIKNAELWHEITNEHYSNLIAEKNRVMGTAESKKD